MVSLSLHDPFFLASRLVAHGAILTLPGVPLVRELIAEHHWMTDREAAFILVNDDLSVSVRYLRFERLSVHSFGVCLEDRDGIIAAVTALAPTSAPSADDYVDLWQRWQHKVAFEPLPVDRWEHRSHAAWAKNVSLGTTAKARL